MRSTDRRVPEDEALDILEHGEYGVLSTVAAGGRPYIDRLRDVTRVFAISVDSVTGKARRQ